MMPISKTKICSKTSKFKNSSITSSKDTMQPSSHMDTQVQGKVFACKVRNNKTESFMIALREYFRILHLIHL